MSSVIVFAVVVPKHLFVNVPLKMKRLHSNVGSLEAALQQRPEVFHAVDVTRPRTESQSYSRTHGRNASAFPVRRLQHHRYRPWFRNHVLENLRLQDFAIDVRHNLCANLPSSAIKMPCTMVLPSSALCFVANRFVGVHVLLLPTDESLIYFDLVVGSADLGFNSEPLGVQGKTKTDAVHHEPCRLLGNADCVATS